MKNSGNYYKVKTKKFLEADGYLVEYLEKLQRIVTKEGKVLFLKRDLLASDGMAVSDKEFILWNSTDRTHVADHVKRYEALTLPSFIQCWVVVWEPRSKEPEIIIAREGATP